MTAASSSSSRKPQIRPHRKSRAGCSICKRRKVKCDEQKPCSNCVGFGLPCDLVSDGARLEYDTASASDPAPRRGRGRPRKIWTSATEPPATASSPPSTTSAPESLAAVDVGAAPAINLDNAELLLHFVSTTAETLAGGESLNMREFWARNAPHIGLSHKFVLNFVLASAAFHLAYLVKKKGYGTDGEGVNNTTRSLCLARRSHGDYLSLAQQHLTAGLSGFSAQLSQPGPDNCGALYLGAVLTSYCTFAAGPTSPDDLLVCTADREGRSDMKDVAASSASWMPFVHGVRLMHQSFSPDVLFAGLMEPLRIGPPQGPLQQPVYARDGFPRIDWEAALDGLREFIAGGSPDGKPPSTAVYLGPLDNLIGIYAATYGRRSSPGGEITYEGPSENQFIFGWLYRVGPEFVACVRRRDPHALLVLAYYAVLLGGEGIRGGWFVEGWREHIVARVGDFVLDTECRGWMRWPMEQAAPKGDSNGGGASPR
ncbi:hypothetical protein C8A00DRAFT_39310 [Chaetomidium leptoderma]|uniref:Zn(2)-C6 fungal-type domain-containing protein n=1 Tax=Chaetomidium leptoderma TaxID=669021 RepID=A0AAN6VUZ4_9PEZI|nr:hypothetical protein C8A00DRAFT_39310 [Chaetomidium leptoderma]